MSSQPPPKENQVKRNIKFTLDNQAQVALKSLTKESLREVVSADSKMFRAHKVPKG